jgi:hypothetical protein
MEIGDKKASAVRIRFRNDGGKIYARCEVHLVYHTAGSDATKVTFDWKDDKGAHREAHRFAAGSKEPAAWKVATGKNLQTRWVEFEPVRDARR